MPTTERRLLALLNLMTSSNPGERRNATEAACRFIESHSITWMELQQLARKLRDAKVLDTIYTRLFARRYETAGQQQQKARSSSKAQAPITRRCAQCGTEFTPAQGRSDTTPEGTEYGRPRAFCSNACKQKAYRARRKAEKA